MHETCFHCGLPVSEKKPPTSIVFEQQQVFCCHGCQAVCNAIVTAGHGDFYRYREHTLPPINNKNVQHLTAKLEIYDNPDVQKDFVRQHGKTHSAWIILEEIRCAACLWLNERTIRQLKGVVSVQMDYSGQQAFIEWDPSELQFSAILKAISNLGYIAHPFDPSQREALDVEQQQRSVKRLIFAALLGMIVMQTAFSYYFFSKPDVSGHLPLWVEVTRWTNLIICAALLAYPGKLFFVNAWRDLKNRTVGMDVPVALGLLLSWFGSLYSTLFHQDHVYFESIAMFIMLLLFARHIELKARIKANNLLDHLSKIIPKMARLIKTDGVTNVAAIELNEGDLILIESGEVLPVDGYLCSSHGSFDEAVLTGEAQPVEHYERDLLSSGIINVGQTITLEVRCREGQSTHSNIQQLARKSMKFRPQYIETADNIAKYFIAAILSLSLITLFIWLWIEPHVALSHMIAVLIVTCPCALSLASPVAFSMGAAALTRLNMVATKMTIVEQLAHIDTVVFDKTGTLTQGKAVLTKTLCTQTLTEESAIQIAASIENQSSHPFAKALINANQRAHLGTEDVTYYPSQGVLASINQQVWRLGKLAFSNASLNNEQQQYVQSWQAQGNSCVFLSNEKGCQAIFLLSDPLREGIAELLDSLKNKSIHIISGDHAHSVAAIAKQLNIKHALGGLSPDEKLSWIKTQQRNGRKVMMFGDGVNDAPTLAAADLSISFSDASDLAQRHSNLIIFNNNYNHLVNGFSLLNKTRNIIRQNLVWAATYNVVAVPAAAMGWVSPWMAAIGMSLSSLLVIINSMRLKREIKHT